MLSGTIKTKRCSKCGEIKPLSGFNKNKTQKDGLQSYCKICRCLYDKEYRQNNRDALLQQQKEYRQNNKDKIRANKARRRAAKRDATPPWADQAAIEAIYTEALWLQDFTGEPCHVDHIVPLKSDFVCGLHVPANLQTLPGAENIAKSNRSWPEQLSCQTRRGIDHQWWKELYARTVALEE